MTEHYHLYGPELFVEVFGQPAPQGSKRIGRVRGTGRPIVLDDSARTRPWREAVKAAALAVIGDHAAWRTPLPLAGPVALDITFTVPKPTSAPKQRRIWPAKRPDLDKLTRSTLDALRDAGVYRDDAQVIQLGVRKAYPGEHPQALAIPGAVIFAYTVGESAPPSQQGVR